MVSSSAEAFVDYSSAIDATVDVATDGAITIRAVDDASIDAQTRMYAEVSPTNDAATGLLNNLVGTLTDD